MTKDRIAKVQFTYEELAERLHLRAGVEILSVEETYDKVSIVVASSSLPIKPRGRVRTIVGSTLEALFSTSPPKPPAINVVAFRETLKWALRNHARLLFDGKPDDFVQRFLSGYEEYEEELEDDDI